MDLIAKLPTLAALIYRTTFKDGNVCALDATKDRSANFTQMLGFKVSIALHIALHSLKCHHILFLHIMISQTSSSG